MSASFVAGIVVMGRRCVVLGEGAEAVDKARRLLDAGADVTVYAPRPEPMLEALGEEKRPGFKLVRRDCDDARDLDRAFFVVLTPIDGARAARLYARAQGPQGFLLCAIDQPAYCTVVNVATVRRGPVQIAISTGGRAPTLASRIRRALDAQLGDDFARFAEALGVLRERAAPGAPRRAIMERALARFSLTVHYVLPEYASVPHDDEGEPPAG